MTLVLAVFVMLLPASALAQQGNIAGTVRDSSGAVLPGVVVEATSPALIEKVRSGVTDETGQYRITNLPVGTYSVAFRLEGFSTVERANVVLSTGFTAPVNVTMAVGQVAETVKVVAETPTVDVQSARQVASFTGADIRDLPTTRNIRSILTMTPGLTPSGLGADCVGNVGVWCNNNIYNLGAHTDVNTAGAFDPPDQIAQDGLNQGRIMVDGTIINTGGGAGIMGMTGGYVADVANSQEVNVQISGALGESETGGATINIVPRTGGNNFAGNYFVTYTRGPLDSAGNGRTGWFSQNNGNYPEINNNYPLVSDVDTSAAFGGPIVRDHLWFFSAGRMWQKNAFSSQVDRIWDNANAGIYGENYEADYSTDPLQLVNWTRNANVRVTWQATRKDKVNFFWDEGFTCQDPCDGSVAAWTSRDGWWSGQVHPARLIQASWTNPLTNTILAEAGLSVNRQLYDFSQHRYWTPNPDIPRVIELGSTVGYNYAQNAPLNTVNFNLFGVPSGPWSDGIGGLAEIRNLNDLRPRASVSYVTGGHNMKIGYDGGYFSQTRQNRTNNPRLEYRYFTPAATCFDAANPAASTCGNTSRYHPEDPYNSLRRPVPDQVKISTGPSAIENRVGYSGFYAQDQWTLKRFTLSGAIRYDHSFSRYPGTCIGAAAGNDLVAGASPEPYVPVQVGGQYGGQREYCTPDNDGVSYHDVTPRWGVTWDLFGNGKTSIKYNQGQYLSGAGISGIYSSANPVERGKNTYTRTWSDLDGDRFPDCDLLNYSAQSPATGAVDACGGPNSVFIFPAGFEDPTRYGRDPYSLDASGQLLGLQTTYCGSTELAIPAAVQSYCNAYGDTLIEGWGRRRSEWQFGLGIQHEILPRLSAEVTYNRRSFANQTVNDALGLGCDRFNSTYTLEECNDLYLNHTHPDYGFYTVTAPSNPDLPSGGGYVVRGLADPNALRFPGPTAVTILQTLEYSWNGVDTNFVWRAPGGLRVNGGTSTGRSVRDLCHAATDAPNVKVYDGAAVACNPHRRWDTNVRGTAAYTIPKIDMLVSSVFQWRPGVERAANYTFNKNQLTWDASSAFRATQPCANPANGTGCLTSGNAGSGGTTTTVNLLNTGEVYGEPYSIVDLKIAKNIKFANKRLNVGVDIYNLFNDDAIRSYQDTLDTVDNPNTPVVEKYGQATSLLSPRFVRLSVQFDF
ncbi:MAG TPA: carboxypeptidase-like regulatory domain-containing protein [Vicinamibacterales bacterium]|nr:carboxypeptidase-like regulatory domain-containing protein [Vicinamibacterales bacterium]